MQKKSLGNLYFFFLLQTYGFLWVNLRTIVIASCILRTWNTVFPWEWRWPASVLLLWTPHRSRQFFDIDHFSVNADLVKRKLTRWLELKVVNARHMRVACRRQHMQSVLSIDSGSDCRSTYPFPLPIPSHVKHGPWL